MLQIRQFSKSYGDHLVLAIEDVSIPPGVHWVKGDNGSGKTTLFKSLAGIIPCLGEITLHSITANKEPLAYRKLVTFSEAEPQFPDFLTAKDLVRFVGKTRGSTPDEQDLLCRRMGVDLYFNKSCGTHSSGMLKKLSLALAFLGKPKLIILDEPLVTLDELSRKILLGMIVEKSQDPSMTFLLSSHQSIDPALLLVNQTFCIRNKTLERV